MTWQKKMKNKIGEKDFGELLMIRQVCQSFLSPKFSSIRYLNYEIHWNLASIELLSQWQ